MEEQADVHERQYFQSIILIFVNNILGNTPYIIYEENKMRKRIEIRKEHIEEILILSDNMRPAQGLKHASLLSRYKFWTRIEELYPETAKGDWNLDCQAATSPAIVEDSDNNECGNNAY